MRHLLLGGACLALLTAFDGSGASAAGTALVQDRGSAAEAAAGPRFGTFGFDLEGMDPTASPGDDFYRYANGAWDDATDIPADRARYGVFDMLSLESEEVVQRLIEDAAREGGASGSNNQLIGDLYASWMDAETIEAAGLEPARPWLDRIAAISSHDEAAALMADLHHAAPYSLWIIPDPSDTTVYTAGASQSGLGMPDREYYFDPSERFEQYREAYRAYIVRLHELAGIDDAEARADGIIAFETSLADAQWSRERSRQIAETFNVMSVEEFAALAPSLRLTEALAARGLGNQERLIVSQPSAIEAAGETFAQTDLAVIRDYLTFHFLSDRASWLPSAFDEARFDFHQRTLSGTESQRSRERRGAELVGFGLGHAVGQEYVARHFPPEARAQMEELVDNLLTGFRGRLERLEWMDEETRAEALTKLSTFETRIGYPELWDSYEGLQIAAEDHFGNRIRMTEHAWNEQISRLDEPVDRRRWSWPPQIVNASYNPVMNQITFPAGILQPPFFDMHADAAMNYGAIGAVIGHEIGHGFDDQGRRFDASGDVRDWWTPQTNALFEEASGRLADQYSEFCPIDDLCVNGRLALGENIGDLGGMQMAYEAYRNHVAETYPDGEAPVIDGFTGDQRFFLAWAQVWRTLYRDDALRAQLVNGPHSPGMYRVNGVVRNLDAWYEAFEVTEEHELYLPPEERVSIW
jgi:putative endopeptidase